MSERMEAARRTRMSVLLLLVLAVSSGCVHRSLTVRSDPPGAQVFLNDQLRGKTPLTFDFQWYGTHRVTLRKEGFERLDDKRLVRAPVHMWIPLDLLMEAMPFAVRDDRVWDYTLAPIAMPDFPPATPEKEPIGDWKDPEDG